MNRLLLLPQLAVTFTVSTYTLNPWHVELNACSSSSSVLASPIYSWWCWCQCFLHFTLDEQRVRKAMIPTTPPSDSHPRACEKSCLGRWKTEKPPYQHSSRPRIRSFALKWKRAHLTLSDSLHWNSWNKFHILKHSCWFSKKHAPRTHTCIVIPVFFLFWRFPSLQQTSK